MKFKYLIIAFSAIIVIILLAAIFLPALVSSGKALSLDLRQIALPLFSIIMLLLISLSVFFFLNYRLLSLLEREDWPALTVYLEQKIYNKKRYSSRFVRLLASSYLVMSDFMSVIKLEGKTLLAKPSVVKENVLIFGAARVLSGKYGEAASFFKSYTGKCKGKDKDWVRWFYGFSHLLGGAFNLAEPEFSSLAASSRDAIVTGLSSYFLFNSIEKYSVRPAECRQIHENGRERVISALRSINGWNAETAKMSNEIHVAIIRKYIEATGAWVFNIQVPVPIMENSVSEDIYNAVTEQRSGEDRRKAQRRANPRYSEDRRKGDRREK